MAIFVYAMLDIVDHRMQSDFKITIDVLNALFDPIESKSYLGLEGLTLIALAS